MFWLVAAFVIGAIFSGLVGALVTVLWCYPITDEEREEYNTAQQKKFLNSLEKGK